MKHHLNQGKGPNLTMTRTPLTWHSYPPAHANLVFQYYESIIIITIIIIIIIVIIIIIIIIIIIS